MKIRFVGTGGPFDDQLTNSSALVTMLGKSFLIDCGHSVFPKLKATGKEAAMDYVLLTHMHDDHIGSLASLVLYNYYHHQRKLTLIYPTESFLQRIKQFLSFSVNDPDTLLDFLPASSVSGLGFIDTTGHHVSYLQSFAYLFEEDGERILYSGDIGNGSLLFSHLKNLSPKNSTVFHDLSFRRDTAHTYYKDLFPHLQDYRIYGYHVDAACSPADNIIPLVQNLPELLL